MKSSFFRFSRLEILFLAIFVVGIIASTFGIAKAFVAEHSSEIPTNGGKYTEGIVGNPYDMVLNPVFLHRQLESKVDADIGSLIFAGLMHFNAETGKEEDYLADHTLSPDKKTYIFHLKKGLKWHDGHPVTAGDVMFTFRDVIQHPDFQNTILKDAFKDVKITKEDEYTVKFEIPEAYKFFISNFTVGLLPRHILENIDIANLQQSDFSQHPIGCGPYVFAGITDIRPFVSQMNLTAFRDSSAFSPKIDTIAFQFYPTRDSLFISLDDVDGVRPFPTVEEKDFFIDPRFSKEEFTLPQYSALFLNLSKEKFKGEPGRNLRLALQLGTNKDAILQNLVPGKRIDTPLMEADSANWLFEYDSGKAQGAIKEAGWYLPNKMPKTISPKNADEKWIDMPSSEKGFETSKTSFSFGGKMPKDSDHMKIMINGKETNALVFDPKKQEWSLLLKVGEAAVQYERNEARVLFFNKKNDKVGEDAISFYIAPAEQSVLSDTPPDPIRQNLQKEKLSLELLTVSKPAYYPEIAKYLQSEWQKIGVDLHVTVLDSYDDFYDRVNHREYDVLLFGQNLGYNADIYEYFHESQAGKLNLSEYKSPRASALIEEIRRSHDELVQKKSLQELQSVLKQDVPAIFLFSPRYTLLIDKSIKNHATPHIALLKDRFSGAQTWYMRTDEVFQEGVSWRDIPAWVSTKLSSLL
ncbi:MAG: ABC transporter substrate-binding protein [Candidatus Peregrinibacteria bacterium]